MAMLDPVRRQQKQTNKHVRWIQTDNNKRQTSTALDVWVYQRRESETKSFNNEVF